jgi:hypothetical protein
MIGTILSVAIGVVLGGIVLSWLHAKGQERIRRLRYYWEQHYSTPVHMDVFISAKNFLLDLYGEKYVDRVIDWANAQKLMLSPEKRLAKLDAMSEENIIDSQEIRMYRDVLRHLAIRQWATECGLNDAFEQWEKDCLEKLSAREEIL